MNIYSVTLMIPVLSILIRLSCVYDYIQILSTLKWERKDQPGRDAIPHPFLVPWSRKSTAIHLLPVGAVRPVQCHSACTVLHISINFIKEDLYYLYFITNVIRSMK